MTTLLDFPETSAHPLILRTRPAIDIDDTAFFAFCEQNPDLRIEQTVHGDWIIMPPTGFEIGSSNADLTMQIGNWARKDGTGVAVDSSTGFVLPNGAKRSPDAAWITRTRLAALTPEQKRKFLPLCPDFVVELRSPSDALEPLQEKMEEYRENGARLGWLLDTVNERIFVYRPGEETAIMDAPQSISGDPELPGFVLDLSPIWNPDI